MRITEIPAQKIASKRLLHADIRRADSEMLLFVTLFGSPELKQLAKTELSERTLCDENEISDAVCGHNFSIAANC